jgi:hypothetical protein
VLPVADVATPLPSPPLELLAATAAAASSAEATAEADDGGNAAAQHVVVPPPPPPPSSPPLAAEQPRGTAAAAAPPPVQEDQTEECVVCLNAPPAGAFLPCGHRHACLECGERVMQLAKEQKKRARCPCCNVRATHFVGIYI